MHSDLRGSNSLCVDFTRRERDCRRMEEGREEVREGGREEVREGGRRELGWRKRMS